MNREHKITEKQYNILSELVNKNKIKYNSLKLSIKTSDEIQVGIFNIKNLTTQKIYIMNISDKDRMKLIKKLRELKINIRK